MNLFESLAPSLFSPMVLAFLLGIVASLVRSDLKIPPEIYAGLTIYLLFAIGLKGGAKLDGVSVAEAWRPIGAGLLLSMAIPVWSYFILKNWGRFDAINAAALAAHYGSVSAVTFGNGIAFLDAQKTAHEPFLPALLAVMEVPAILIAIFLVSKTILLPGEGGRQKLGKLLHELLTGKGILLLLGGMAIGLLTGKKGAEQVAPLFDAPFRGVLTLFLLEVGMVTGRRLTDLRACGPRLIIFATLMPALHGLLGVWLGKMAGLSLGGATILGILAASASYIAAPAAVRIALPQASPAVYLTAALAITFPFNVILGIPIYYSFAGWLFNA